MTDDFSGEVALAAEVVAAYVSNHKVAAGELSALIGSVVTAFRGPVHVEPEPEVQKPAVSIRKAVQADHIVCLEDGMTFKSLKRHLMTHHGHLMTHHGMTPAVYRAKWGLPGDYPMVAPAYAAARSELARKMGLGQKRQAATAEPSPVAKPKRGASTKVDTPAAPEKPKRGRPKAKMSG